MIKIFLVEDEIVMREGIRNSIQTGMKNVEFAGEASDGELAYPLIKKVKPDIVLMDIKMPFMDGIELSRIIKEEMPRIKIIILSGHNDFDYAKEAISIGVTDYLLKPISAAKLYEAIDRVIAMIQKENDTMKYLYYSEQDRQEYVRREKQKFFFGIISNRLIMSEILEQGKSLGVEIAGSVYKVCLFSLLMKDNSGTYFSKEMVEAQEEVVDCAQNIDGIGVFERDTEGYIFMLQGDTKEDIQGRENLLFERISQIMKSRDELEYFVGVGGEVGRMSMLAQSYEEATRAFSYRYLLKSNQIVHYHDIRDIQGKQQNIDLDIVHMDFEKIDRAVLLKFLKNGLQEEVPGFLQNYFDSIGKDSMKSMFFRQYLSMDIYLGTIAFVESLGCSAEAVQETAIRYQYSTVMMASWEDTIVCLTQIISKGIEMRDDLAGKKYHSILQNAKSYIDLHFGDEDISLNSVAALANISPNHFSTIFGQEEGLTFIEYLTQIRMEKAKELLMCSNMKSSEIGYVVGYKDPHYFSFLFKKTQDCTPKEYRLRGKDQRASEG